MFSCLLQLPFLLRTNLTAKSTNSLANGKNSIAKVTNSIANGMNSTAKTCNLRIISRHTIVCRAAQEAGAPHREYINRKKERKHTFHTYVAL